MAPLEPSKTIKQFCEFERISESYYFKMRSEGRGPDETRSGRRVTITPEAHRRWRKRHTRPAGKAAPQPNQSIAEIAET
jgi:hypothetical protein